MSSSRAASQERPPLAQQSSDPRPWAVSFHLLNPYIVTASRSAYSESKPLSLAALRNGSLHRSMGLVAADLISAVAASLYYFLFSLK